MNDKLSSGLAAGLIVNMLMFLGGFLLLEMTQEYWPFVFLMFAGFTQWIVLLPLLLYTGFTRKLQASKGILLAGGLVFLASAMCFGLPGELPVFNLW